MSVFFWQKENQMEPREKNPFGYIAAGNIMMWGLPFMFMYLFPVTFIYEILVCFECMSKSDGSLLLLPIISENISLVIGLAIVDTIALALGRIFILYWGPFYLVYYICKSIYRILTEWTSWKREPKIFTLYWVLTSIVMSLMIMSSNIIIMYATVFPFLFIVLGRQNISNFIEKNFDTDSISTALNRVLPVMLLIWGVVFLLTSIVVDKIIHGAISSSILIILSCLIKEKRIREYIKKELRI